MMCNNDQVFILNTVLLPNNGDLHMQKPFVTALLLAATLGLAACDSEPQDKLDAAKETQAAAEQKLEQISEQTPTSEEVIEAANDAAAEAADNTEQALDDAADATEEAASDTKSKLDTAAENVKNSAKEVQQDVKDAASKLKEESKNLAAEAKEKYNEATKAEYAFKKQTRKKKKDYLEKNGVNLPLTEQAVFKLVDHTNEGVKKHAESEKL